MSSIVAFLKDESGATAIEYGLMAAGISVVILATLNTVGSKLNAKFDEISGFLKVRKNSRADLLNSSELLLFQQSHCASG